MILSSFLDPAGREWSVTLDLPARRLLADELGDTLGPDPFAADTLPDLVECVVYLPDLAAAVAFVLCRHQATEYGLTAAGFLRLFDHAATRRAFAGALLAADCRPGPALGAEIRDGLDDLFAALDRRDRLNA